MAPRQLIGQTVDVLSDTPAPIVAIVGERLRPVSPSIGVNFGRTDDAERNIIGLDHDDTGISRFAGSITVENGLGVVTNRSTSANLYIVGDAGIPLVLRPGNAHLLNGPVTIEIRGRAFTHRIEVEAPSPPHDPDPSPAHLASTEVKSVHLTDNDRRALAAVFERYLQPGPRRDCVPESYADAGERLGLPASTVRRRIERVRGRLGELGVYFDGQVAKEQLIAHLIDHDLLDARDLELLGDR